MSAENPDGAGAGAPGAGPSPPGPGLASRLFGAPGSPRAWHLFELAFRPWMARQLAAVHLAGVEEARAALGAGPGAGAAIPSSPAPPPLLLVANHVSWYDGFLLRQVQRELRPGAPFRTFMLRDELERTPVLRWIGGTGFDPSRPATLRGALAEVQGLRASGVVAAYFPQGRIFPATRRPLGFEPGISLLLRRLAPLTVLPVGLHLEMGNRVRPSAWILVGAPLPVEGRDGHRGPVDNGGTSLDPRELESRVQRLLSRIQAHLHTHGEAAGATWPPAEEGGAPRAKGT